MAQTKLLQSTANLWRDYYYQISDGNLGAASQTCQRAIHCHIKADDRRHAGIWRRSLANVLYLQGEYRKAANAARAAVKLQPDSYEKALSYIALGKMEAFAGDLRAGMRALGFARRIGQKFPHDAYLWTHYYATRSYVLERSGRIDEAIIDYEGAIALQRGEGHKWRAALSLNNLAFLLAANGELEEAERRALEALELVEVDPHLHTHACIYDALGYIYTLSKKYYEADWPLRRAASIFEQLKDDAQLAETLVHLSELHRRTNRLDLSADEAVRAMQLSIKMKNKRLIHQAEEQWMSVMRSSQVEHLRVRTARYIDGE
jgi:tetratricopeptide (TPR) repeat protein